MPKIRLRSPNFPNVYVRFDASAVRRFEAGGSGVVNAQFGAGGDETFELTDRPGGLKGLRSTTAPSAYIRLDGTGVTRATDFGGGLVNGQQTIGPYETFRLEQQADGLTTIASTAFTNVFLRLEGTGVTAPTANGGGTVNAQFGAGPLEKFIVETAETVPSADYFDYFFVRCLAARGLTMGLAPTGLELAAAPMLARRRGGQLFKFVTASGADKSALLVNQSTGLAVQWSAGKLRCMRQDPGDAGQRWAFGEKGRLRCDADATHVLALRDGRYAMVASDDNDASQRFEPFFPSDFVYVRNAWSGRFLTAGDGDAVAWSKLDPARDDAQQWGLTGQNQLVSRAAAKALQLSGAPGAGVRFALGDAAAVGVPEAARQRFDVNALDGAIHSLADRNFVLGQSNADVVAATLTAGQYTQLAELMSPFQFFGLQNQGVFYNTHNWLARRGAASQELVGRFDGKPEQMFTVSRYGEIVSRLDGFVLQAGRNSTPVQFVDPAPEPIGYDSTTFKYQTGGGDGTIGGISERSDGRALVGVLTLAKMMNAMMSAPLSGPASGASAWKMVGPSGELFAAYQDQARAFFADPAPLPGASAAAAAPTAFKAELSKTERVVLALLLGTLDIVGLSVADTTTSGAALERAVRLVIANPTAAQRAQIIVGGTVTAASVISFLDAVADAGLWRQVLAMVLPNSFFGWLVKAAEIVVFLASFATPAGWALRGARIALVVANVAVVVSGPGV